MKRIILLISFVLIFMALPLTVYAADNDGVLITVVIPKSEQKEEKKTVPAAPPKKYLYPVSIWESQNNGRREIIKTYELSAYEKPENISRESFSRDGWIYELSDITKKETANADVREHKETISIDTTTNDMAALLKLLASEMEFQSDDGYIGVLYLDISSIKVETAGTKSSSYTVSATRQYPNLSSNDTSLIPKTITENGRTLTLSSVDWKVQNYMTVDYDRIADSYTAVAMYTGTASKTTVTGYTTTAEYNGKVSKILTGKTVYTAYFVGIQIITPTMNNSSDTSTLTSDIAEPIETKQTADPITEVESATEPTMESESISEPTESTETAPAFEITTEETTETIQETEPDSNPFNPLLIIIISLFGGIGISGGVVFFYLQKYKNKKEGKHYENEKTD